ncbi:MAG: hypothetical protein ACRC0L_08935, partial [Angustibacter sp.]
NRQNIFLPGNQPPTYLPPTEMPAAREVLAGQYLATLDSLHRLVFDRALFPEIFTSPQLAISDPGQWDPVIAAIGPERSLAALTDLPPSHARDGLLTHLGQETQSSKPLDLGPLWDQTKQALTDANYNDIASQPITPGRMQELILPAFEPLVKAFPPQSLAALSRSLPQTDFGRVLVKYLETGIIPGNMPATGMRLPTAGLLIQSFNQAFNEHNSLMARGSTEVRDALLSLYRDGLPRAAELSALLPALNPLLDQLTAQEALEALEIYERPGFTAALSDYIQHRTLPNAESAIDPAFVEPVARDFADLVRLQVLTNDIQARHQAPNPGRPTEADFQQRQVDVRDHGELQLRERVRSAELNQQ